MARKKHGICMVSDFFYPNTGGVESHIYLLSQCLIARGHKVIVITHIYDKRAGIRYMTSGLKVYYIPVLVIYNQCTLPTLFTTFPIIRHILVREQITIVHGHSAFSALAQEAMFHAKTMGIKTVFTDHSLFGFADASAIITNKLLQMALTVCNQVICVSHIGKENTVLRAGVKPSSVSVIPNAVDTTIFTPDPSKRNPNKITISYISRFLHPQTSEVIPNILFKRKILHVLISTGGDGPKRIVLEEVREQHQLQDRVTLLGAVEHENVRNILVQGDIFLNASLTEAFCMAIVEAASCGLQVVSTRVGGVPEVLPPDLIWLTEPSVKGLVDGLERALGDRKRGRVVPPFEAYSRICSMYQWNNVAQRTEAIYNKVERDPVDDLSTRLKKFKQCGPIASLFFMLLTIIEHLLLLLFNWWIPVETIDFAVDLKT
ncbi:N-acetylglucosaminyl-phosphatidylinositol biosynthetic protein-like [Centruroides sculpturatus]|uniref:N-acetylglucosaminyl-phosphatidylinositol biosynthetic protein-like n=1 Tax=Centruroides sculpturatus TaxID=218467 RepID=UPI000C6DFED9|nr:N-acetylglucosaminyl-phosphatidylinositol biosynthetic protein-like [Centruroides sculpturatus]